MGKVHSIFGVTGKLGEYVFYRLNGKEIVRRAAAKKKGPKTPAQQTVVKQNTEFGKASAAGKFLRTALAEECAKLNDRYLYQRISKLMLSLKSFDPAPNGQRTVTGGLATPEGQHVLACFNFHKKHADFSKLLQAVRSEGQLHLSFSLSGNPAETIIELQLDFHSGKFRRHVHTFREGYERGKLMLKKQFRSKKGFTDLLLISGDGYLQGVVVGENHPENG
ncbi:MAG: hypothetical protein L6264_04995 [Weeksellaceae bacterium]|nr:hypothetical protein [Bacteroidota bacterium]MCG2780286.1 hypothetical protein [Weeksellaceae bacterium]